MPTLTRVVDLQRLERRGENRRARGFDATDALDAAEQASPRVAVGGVIFPALVAKSFHLLPAMKQLHSVVVRDGLP